MTDPEISEKLAEINTHVAAMSEAAVKHANAPSDLNLLELLNRRQALANRLSALSWDLVLENAKYASAYYAELMTAIATVRSEQITNQVNPGEKLQ